ncbi:aquaporin [uncultured Fibrella sp.]|uniref:aquaporin n=1 Tax=uncultured Fibrella sp. TaxID=1284596 RepID=UPI0035C97EBF
MRAFVAELIGTALLVFITVGVDVIAPKGAGLLGIGATAGLTYAALFYSVAQLSGGQLNPVLSLAAYRNQALSARGLAKYILAQVTGAILGAGGIWLVVQGLPAPYDITTFGFAHNGWGTGYVDAYAMSSALIIEFVGSTALAVVYLTTRPLLLRGLTVGALLMVLHWLGLYVTGASYNPAYSVATALFAGADALRQVWLFIVVPMVGSLAGASISRYLVLSEYP